MVLETASNWLHWDKKVGCENLTLNYLFLFLIDFTLHKILCIEHLCLPAWLPWLPDMSCHPAAPRSSLLLDEWGSGEWITKQSGSCELSQPTGFKNEERQQFHNNSNITRKISQKKKKRSITSVYGLKAYFYWRASLAHTFMTLCESNIMVTICTKWSIIQRYFLQALSICYSNMSTAPLTVPLKVQFFSFE